MGFFINTNGIPKLGNWAAAEHHERTVTPIRGRTVKPLGKRSSHHTMKIERREEDAIVCKLYNTDVVTFYKDGRIGLKHQGWNTQSTVKFINAVLDYPNQVSVQGGNMLLHQRVANQRNQLVWIIPGVGLMLNAPVGLMLDAAGTPMNPVPCAVHQIDRKGAKQVRQLYAAFTTQVVAMCKLIGDSAILYTGSVVLPEVGVEPDSDEWLAAVQACVMSSAGSYYNYAAHKHVFTALPKRAKKVIQRLAYERHRDTVFTTTVLPAGQYKSDTYKSYFD